MISTNWQFALEHNSLIPFPTIFYKIKLIKRRGPANAIIVPCVGLPFDLQHVIGAKARAPWIFL
jgi:hypothetical protein